MKHAFIHFAEGFEEIEAITIVDVLRRADIPTLMVSVSGNIMVTGAHGIAIKTDILFEKADYNNAEILILPGGMPGSQNLNTHKGLKDQLLEFNTKGKKIAAICAAPMVLGGLNILEGKQAVCYPGYEDQLAGAEIHSYSTLRSDNILTGRAAGAALNFSLEIVKILKSGELANKLAKAMLVETWADN